MWNSWQYLRQDKACQRLVIALGLSFLLHLFLLGEIGFHFPDFAENHHLIEARLVAAKPAPVLGRVAPVKKQAPPIKSLPSKKPVPENQLSPQPIAETLAEHVVGEHILPADQFTSKSLAAVTEQLSQDHAVMADQPEEAAINPNAYKYVETEFDVRTDLEAKVGAAPAGKATIVYELLPNGGQYRLKNLIVAKGLLALFMPNLLQTSEGFLSSTGLQPQHYLYQFGDKKNKTFSADFDWGSKALTLHSAKGDRKLTLSEGTQDLLSFMYQFMFIPPLQTMQLSITNGKKLAIYDYGFEGEETIATKMGNLSTLHLLRGSDDGEEKTELWLALDYQYVPVKIRKTEKEGKVYELLVTSLKTEKSVNEP